MATHVCNPPQNTSAHTECAVAKSRKLDRVLYAPMHLLLTQPHVRLCPSPAAARSPRHLPSLVHSRHPLQSTQTRGEANAIGRLPSHHRTRTFLGGFVPLPLCLVWRTGRGMRRCKCCSATGCAITNSFPQSHTTRSAWLDLGLSPLQSGTSTCSDATGSAQRPTPENATWNHKHIKGSIP